jgi:DNA-binding CsgD family transcriptional regulator
VTPAVNAQLLERDGELAVLRELIAAGGGGGVEAKSVALVEGPAGIGKSSLLKQALAAATEAGCTTASARGSELERGFAFGLVRQLFEPLLSAVSPAERERLFDGAAGLAAPLLQALDASDLSPGGEASHAALHGLYWLTVNLATEAPLALVVDDAHWADAPSLRFLAYLVNRIAELPVFLAVATRTDEPGAEVDLLDELAAHPSTRVIQPPPLSAHAVEELVRAALGPDADPTFASACFEASTGNPLFLGELLATLIAEGIAPTAGQAGRVLETAPRSVARSVSRRLRRLAPEAAQLARAVAVLGDGADPRVAATLAGLDLAAAAAASETLARAEFLDPDKLEFVHPVVRAAVYAELSPVERARQHRVAAGVLAEQGADEDEVALHVLAGEPGGDGWAVDVLRRAARRAHARGAPDVAATYLQRAIAEQASGDDRVDLLVELGLTELAALRPSGLAHTREALKLAGDPRLRARVSLELGRSLLIWGNFGEAAKVFQEALVELGDRDPELGERLEAQLISASLLAPSAIPGVIDRIAPLIMDSSHVSDPVLLAALSVVLISVVAPAARGAELAERALEGGLSLKDDPAIVAMAAIALMAADRLDQAGAVWDRALVDARRLGSFYLNGFAWTLRAFVLVRRGALAKAEADAGRALEGLGAETRLLLTIPWMVTSLVDVLIERGELEEASRLLGQHNLAGDLPGGFQTSFLLESMGRLRIAQNRIDEGIAHLRKCGRRLEALGVSNPGLIPWRASLAPALAAAGEREEALELARKEIDLARSFEVSRELGMALRAAGLVTGGGDGIALLREATSVLESSPAPLEHARALTDLGAALRRKGQRAEAREPLRTGLDLAQRCGATALVQRAHAELVASGARPRRLVLSGLDALTASERRVAEMACEGLTNRQIAQALFVTEKTVEGHLGQAYGKLDVKSRSELPQALIPREPTGS